MAQEDQRCSNNSNTSSGGIGNNINSNNNNSMAVRCSKRQKPKKVPQRGLGVAQLERIRLEEQEKKDAAAAAAAHHHHHHHHQKSSSSSPSPYGDLSPPRNNSSSIFRPPPFSVQYVDVVVSGNHVGGGGGGASVPLTKNSNNNNNIGCSSSSSSGWGNYGTSNYKNNGDHHHHHHHHHKLWSASSCEFNYGSFNHSSIEKECFGLDPGLAFKANLSLPYESEPIWPLPSLMQRATHFQHPSSSMMNLSSRTSSTSVLNFQMEPPSNQSYYGTCTSLLPEEEKMVGMKRSYPFSLDNAPGPPIHTKYPSIVHTINGQVEAASSSNGSTFNFEPGTPNFREGPSCSTSNLEPKSKKSNTKQNGVSDGDFLTLAPPTTTAMSSTSKLKHPPSNLIYYNCELPDLDTLAYQGGFEDSIMKQGAIGFNQYRPYYSFFPPAMVQIDRATTISMANCKGGEVGGHVDLNLKL